MTKLGTREAQAIAPIAERALARWAMGLRIGEGRPEQALARLPEEVHPFVAISREAGTGGEEMGKLVATALGCECLGHELLTFMAERYNLPADLMQFVDETTWDLLRGVFRRWLDSRVITQDEYVKRLGELMLMAARHGTVVFVGRGAQFLLPRDKALAVRIIAPLERRVDHAMARRQLDRHAAESWVRDIERGRRDFGRQQFHQDVTDVRLYDLVVNLEHLEPAAVASTIVQAFRARFG